MPTDAQRAAAARYLAKLGRIDLRPAPELDAEIRDHAQRRGESVSGFLFRAARETMDRDRERDRDGKTE